MSRESVTLVVLSRVDFELIFHFRNKTEQF